MPILHKYNFSKLLKHVARLVELEVAWAQGSKTRQQTVGEWLWLLDELQLVGLHSAFNKLIKGLPRSRVLAIGFEVSTATANRKRISAVGMVMAELSPSKSSRLNGVIATPTCNFPHQGHRLNRTGGGCVWPSCAGSNISNPLSPISPPPGSPLPDARRGYLPVPASSQIKGELLGDESASWAV
eukprot:gene7477-622_t